MIKPNFTEMSFKELRTYVLQHRDDNEAFYIFVDRMQQMPKVKIESDEQLRQFILEREGKYRNPPAQK